MAQAWRGSFLSPEQYKPAVTCTGPIMLLFFATPILFASRNTSLPLQYRRADVRLPAAERLCQADAFAPARWHRRLLTPGGGGADFRLFGLPALANVTKLARGRRGTCGSSVLRHLRSAARLGAVNMITDEC